MAGGVLLQRISHLKKYRFISQGVSDYLKSKKNLKSKNPRVVIGFDTRFLSDLFAKSAAEIFMANDIETILSDSFVPAPVLSNAVVSREADIGIMITASHNPYRYNGYKIKGPYGGSATMDIISDIEESVNTGINNGQYLKKLKAINEDINNNKPSKGYNLSSFLPD